MPNLDLFLLEEEEAAGSRWSRGGKFMWVKCPHLDPLGVTMEVVMLPGWIWPWSRKAWPARMSGCVVGCCPAADLGKVRSGGTSRWPGGVWISEVDITGGYGGVRKTCKTEGVFNGTGVNHISLSVSKINHTECTSDVTILEVNDGGPSTAAGFLSTVGCGGSEDILS